MAKKKKLYDGAEQAYIKTPVVTAPCNHINFFTVTIFICGAIFLFFKALHFGEYSLRYVAALNEVVENQLAGDIAEKTWVYDVVPDSRPIYMLPEEVCTTQGDLRVCTTE